MVGGRASRTIETTPTRECVAGLARLAVIDRSFLETPRLVMDIHDGPRVAAAIYPVRAATMRRSHGGGLPKGSRVQGELFSCRIELVLSPVLRAALAKITEDF